MQLQEVIIVLVVISITEDAKSDLMGRVIVNFLLESDFNALKSEFESGGSFTVHLIH